MKKKKANPLLCLETKILLSFVIFGAVLFALGGLVFFEHIVANGFILLIMGIVIGALLGLILGTIVNSHLMGILKWRRANQVTIKKRKLISTATKRQAKAPNMIKLSHAGEMKIKRIIGDLDFLTDKDNNTNKNSENSEQDAMGSIYNNEIGKIKNGGLRIRQDKEPELPRSPRNTFPKCSKCGIIHLISVVEDWICPKCSPLPVQTGMNLNKKEIGTGGRWRYQTTEEKNKGIWKCGCCLSQHDIEIEYCPKCDSPEYFKPVEAQVINPSKKNNWWIMGLIILAIAVSVIFGLIGAINSAISGKEILQGFGDGVIGGLIFFAILPIIVILIYFFGRNK